MVTCKIRLYVFDNCLVHLKSTHTSATIHKKTTRKVTLAFYVISVPISLRQIWNLSFDVLILISLEPSNCSPLSSSPLSLGNLTINCWLKTRVFALVLFPSLLGNSFYPFIFISLLIQFLSPPPNPRTQDKKYKRIKKKKKHFFFVLAKQTAVGSQLHGIEI